MAKLSIEDLDLAARRVLVRVDFNVPFKKGTITDDTRIRASLPTIRYALDRGAIVVLASHFGRPKGKPNPEYSLRPVAARLAELLGQPVEFAEACIGPVARDAVDRAARGSRVVLLENVRFHAEEEQNDAAFAAGLAALAEAYVNDAFGCSHRAHASVEAVAHLLPRPAAGFLVQRELEHLGHALGTPPKPFVAVLGGAKVSDKIEVIDNLLGRVDALLVGGAMAYTFLRSRGVAVGGSLVEDDKLEEARRITAHAAERGVRLELPVDHVVTERIEANAPYEALAVGDPAIGSRIGVDIGPATRSAYQAVLASAKTVVWNGPMGVFETPPFDEGTNAVARAIAEVKGTTIIGGGDSAAAVVRAGVAERVTHISTGGGASLEYLGGRLLPGIEVLAER